MTPPPPRATPVARRGQKVMRVAAQQREVNPQRRNQLGRHHAQQVGALVLFWFWFGWGGDVVLGRGSSAGEAFCRGG
jgi:hypothetical protein